MFLQTDSGKALSWYKPIACYKFVHVVHFLWDVLQPLSILSKMYQTKDLDYTEVPPCGHNRENYKADTNSGTKLSHFLSDVPSEPVLDQDGLYTFEFEGHPIGAGKRQRKESLEVCKQFGNAIVKSVNARFSDNHDTSVLTSLTFLTQLSRKTAKLVM